MTEKNDARIWRMEDQPAPKGLELFTWDELHILDWMLARAALTKPNLGKRERDKHRQDVESVETDIIAQAERIGSADYARHLAWCRKMWLGRTGQDDYVCAVTGSEYDGWEYTDIMQRRAALRARPDVQQVIARAVVTLRAEAAAGQPAPLHPYCIFNEERCRVPERCPKGDAAIDRWVVRRCRGDCADASAAITKETSTA
jgi:hypothetical protein